MNIRIGVLLAVLILLATTLALAACGGDSGAEGNGGGSTAAGAQADADDGNAAADSQASADGESADSAENAGAADAGDGVKADAVTLADGEDFVIPVSGVTEIATFYPVKINGTDLEILAVKASDGSIRTAFNTCQVCYSSGRGYYKQENSELVCQNCGNRFTMDAIETAANGCNPVPITADYKTVDDANVTIPYDYLTEATVIFENWKAAA